ncbi:MAG: zf-HC2 domain-containing protein [Candidatus Aminicenantaceae bacterium]
MKCQQIERWLSDSVDGAISKKEKAIIEAHIETCPACRTFRNQIQKINEEAKNLDAPEVSPAQSREFVSRLRSALIEIGEEKNKGVLHVFRNKWVFVPASVIIISLFILIFIFYEKGDFRYEEFSVFSFGNAVEEIYQDMGSDLVLQQAFNSLVSASINEMLITAELDETLNLEDGFLLWEEFSEEGLGNLESQIKKDRNL